MNRTAPGKADIASMAPFIGLPLDRIHVPATQEGYAAATAEILAAGTVGFDTESKPTFSVGESSDGPHVVQFALHDKAYLFQTHRADCHPFLIALLQSPQLLKAGFGLRSDGKHIQAKFGIRPGALVDLNQVFSRDGFQKEMGVRNAVAQMFGQRFIKSRKVTTSNWALPELSAQQRLYAANDAYAALRVLQALAIPRASLPVMDENLPQQGMHTDDTQS
ncbi:3'-5' exonuclease [Sideroxyarcus sp. TK5]|jgi:ribonuclease D